MWHFRRHPRHRKSRAAIALERAGNDSPPTPGSAGGVLIDVSDSAVASTGPHDEGLVQVTRLRAVAVLRPSAHEGITGPALREATARLDAAVKVVVVDLAASPTLAPSEIRAMSTASRAVARRGQEMLIVNLDEASAEALRRAGVAERAGIVAGPFGHATTEP